MSAKTMQRFISLGQSATFKQNIYKHVKFVMLRTQQTELQYNQCWCDDIV